MTERPHETVVIALLDAVATGPVLDTGGIDRAAVECAEALHGINGTNIAPERYRSKYPAKSLSAEPVLKVLREGLRLLAEDGVSWLLDQGHIITVGERGLAIGGKPFVTRSGPYVPGTDMELDWQKQPLRRVIPKRLELLRESVERLPGLKGYFPVLLDTDGDVVDGRHRRRLDPEWPAAPQRVPSDSRTAAAIAANRSNPWDSTQWTQLSKYAEYVHGKEVAGRELARLALRENPKLSVRQVAGLVGCSKSTAHRAKKDLEQTVPLGQFGAGTGGRPRQDGTPAQPRKQDKPRKQDDPQLIAAVREAMISGTFNRNELAGQFGCSVTPVRIVYERLLGQMTSEPATKPAPKPVAEDVSELLSADAILDEQVTEPEAKPEPELPPMVDEVDHYVPDLVAYLHKIRTAVSSPEVFDQIWREALDLVRR